MSNYTRLWTWHVAAGLILIVLLGLHMFGMHLNDLFHFESFNPEGGSPIDWANVAARGRSLGFAVTYVLLLGAALFHGFYGLRNIVLELGPGAAVKRALGWVLILAGLALFVLGTWAAWTGHLVASAA